MPCCANEVAKEKKKEEEKNTTTLAICHGALLATTGDYLRKCLRNFLYSMGNKLLQLFLTMDPTKYDLTV